MMFLRKTFGWVLTVLSAYLLIVCTFLTGAALFGALETESFGEQIAISVIFLILAVLFFGLLRLGLLALLCAMVLLRTVALLISGCAFLLRRGSRFLGRCSNGKDLLQRSDLVGLGDHIKDHIQLLLGQDLGVGLGLFKKLGDDLRNFLGGHAEIRRDIP